MPSPWKPSPGLVSPLEFALGCSSGGARTGKPFSSGSASPGAWDCSGRACKAAKNPGLSRSNSPTADAAVWKQSQPQLLIPLLPGELGKGGTGRGRAEQELSKLFSGRREHLEPSHEEQSSRNAGDIPSKPHPVSSCPCERSPNPTFMDQQHSRSSLRFPKCHRFLAKGRSVKITFVTSDLLPPHPHSLSTLLWGVKNPTGLLQNPGIPRAGSNSQGANPTPE